jgi:RNA-directed DNA polymerase
MLSVLPVSPVFTKSYQEIVTVESLLVAWQEFLRGKRKRHDVAAYQVRLMDNLLALYTDLRDRLVHHLIYNELYPFFDRRFVFDSYSCRLDKGVHRALDRFRAFSRKVSRNNTRTCWVLKCDIRKFFASIDHGILKTTLRRHISDAGLHYLLDTIIDSFHTPGQEGRGLPLGNLTSQLFVNVYMNEFDRYAKQTLKAKHYIRYADDFVLLSEDRPYLEDLLPTIAAFLHERLHLSLHPGKVFIKTLASGVDFLGWVHFPNHRVLRTATKRRMIARIRQHRQPETICSYRALLKHGNTRKLQERLL